MAISLSYCALQLTLCRGVKSCPGQQSSVHKTQVSLSYTGWGRWAILEKPVLALALVDQVGLELAEIRLPLPPEC